MGSRVEWFEPRIASLEHYALGRSCRSRILHPRTDRKSRLRVNLLGDRIVVNALDHPGLRVSMDYLPSGLLTSITHTEILRACSGDSESFNHCSISLALAGYPRSCGVLVSSLPNQNTR